VCVNTTKVFPRKLLELCSCSCNMALCLRGLRCAPRSLVARFTSTDSSENIFAEEFALTEEDIEKKRDISRMPPRMLTKKVRGEYTAKYDTDFKPKALRRDFVKFGTASGINPGVAWPNKEEIADLHFIDKRFGRKFDVMKQELEAQKAEKVRQFEERENTIEENLKKLSSLRAAMLAREQKAAAIIEQKRLVMEERIREVREHIGYNVAPSDPKFAEVMEMKEAERKAAEREVRREAKKQRMMQRLMSVPKLVADDAKSDEKAQMKSSATPEAESVANTDAKSGAKSDPDSKTPK